MSKRDKAKAAREAAKNAQAARVATGQPDTWAWLAEASGRPVEELAAFARKEHDGVATAEAVAKVLGVDLPLIEVMDFRKAGYLPEGLLNYLALLGWSPGGDVEILGPDELQARFRLADVNKTPARFDFAKVKALNGEHIRRATVERLLEVQDQWLEVMPGSVFAGVDRERRRAFLTLYQARMETLADLESATRFFFVRPTAWDAAAVDKHLRKGDALAMLRPLADHLATVEGWEVAPLTAALEAFATARGLGLGKVAQPVRVAVTGTAVSPGIGETLALLGREETLSRLRACAEAHGA